MVYVRNDYRVGVKNYFTRVFIEKELKGSCKGYIKSIKRVRVGQIGVKSNIIIKVYLHYW